LPYGKYTIAGSILRIILLKKTGTDKKWRHRSIIRNR
jgi:hypothetical protein